MEPITARLDANSRRMDKIEMNQRNDIEEIRQKLRDVIKKKKNDRSQGAVSNTYAGAASKPQTKNAKEQQNEYPPGQT